VSEHKQQYRCFALSGNKMKHCVSSTIKCIEEIDTFLNTVPHSFLSAQYISAWVPSVAWHISRW